MSAFEQILDDALEMEGIPQNHRDDIRAYLQVLRNRDQKTYEHSVRVGVLASKIAIYAAVPGISARMLLWAGLLHDVGKPRAKKGDGSDSTFYQHEYIGAKMVVRALDRLTHFGDEKYLFAYPEGADEKEFIGHVKSKLKAALKRVEEMEKNKKAIET